MREELESPTAGIITAARAKLVVAGGGYLSDGHGSSDQDDSLSAKSDPVKKIEIDGVEVTQIGKPDKVKSFTTKKGRALPVVGLRDSAKYLIGKMFGQVTAPTNSPTEPSSPPLLQKGEKKKTWTSENNVAGHSTRGVKEDARRGDHKGVSNAAVYGVNVRDTNKISKPSKGSPKSLAEEEVEMQKVPCNNEDCEGVKRSDVIFNGSEQNGKNHQEDEESGDTISEAGTYTIENDQENDEEALARRNIDAVFGVGSHPSIANLQRPVVVPNISEGTDAEHCKTIDFTSEVALSQVRIKDVGHIGWGRLRMMYHLW